MASMSNIGVVAPCGARTKETHPWAANGLTSLLYFLAFGLFFYWMMKKGGCGMHGHGGHDHDGRTPLHFRTHWKASAGVAMATRRGCAD